MTRLEATFERLRGEGALGLFPYVTAGYPDLATCRDLLDAALEAGADGFEIGVPFSDPLADGATMQRTNARALAAGASLDTALELTAHVRARSAAAGVALMSYYNPLLQRGLGAFARQLREAGGDGVIVPDLPAEEAAPLDAALRVEGLDFIQMLAPTSSPDRVGRAASFARGFIYCVALAGVTGARQELGGELGPFLGRVRGATPVPLVVGFGISRPEHVRAVAELGGDGVIVASALADLVEGSDEPVRAAHAYLAEMKGATRPQPVG